MLFGLSHREKRVKKMNLLHFPVSTLKNFLILELPEPSTDFFTSKNFVILKLPEPSTDLGAVHMSRASPANRADLSHENLYFSTT